jgi:hypothetical protein
VHYVGSHTAPQDNGYIVQDGTKQHLVKSINNDWYTLEFQNGGFFTNPQRKVQQYNNTLGLGYWSINDERHPDHKGKTPQTTVEASSSNIQQNPQRDPNIEVITARIYHAATLQGMNPLDTEPTQPPVMSNIEETIQAGEEIPLNVPPAAAATLTIKLTESEKGGSLRGNKPDKFDGSRKDSEAFLNDFRVYWKINKKNPAMKEPYS